ncbi:hypothetical protein NJB18091_15650 [Mycobacterium marinum]|nr:hypothetical protein NJB18091_15650 [Mycobacterium marinum]
MVMIGEAAHITAASPGGPRYDPELTSEERRNITNGIWCCRNCGKLIDSDHTGYSVELLRGWKLEAERRAAREISAIGAGSPIVKLSKVLSGHENYVWDVVVTPDGRTAISASNDCTLRVWDIASGLPRSVLTGHTTWACSACADPTGTMVAGGAVDGTVRLWNLHTGEPIGSLPANATDAKVAWIHDGRLVVGDSSGVVRVWAQDPSGWTTQHERVLHSAAILKIVAFGRDDEIATASADGTTVVWHADTGQIRVVLTGHTGDVNSVAIDRTGNVALTGGRDRSVALWDLAEGSCQVRMTGHLDIVWRVAISPLDTILASGSGDNTVRLWDRQTGTCLDELAHPDCVAAVTFDPTGTRLIVGCDDDNLYVYEVLQPAGDECSKT